MIKKILPIFCLFWSFFLFSQPESLVIIEDKTTLPILTPSFSERQTLKLKLENGLQAYLISDPKIDKSSAALTVKTGSWEDPKDYPGIAHFLEHMLFLGTKKYPKESEYNRYISEHAGLSNAFTANDITSYLFCVENNAFDEAVDRFSRFFTEPLFNPSGVARELQAIDQEYAKNLENDGFREYYVHKALTNPEHPQHGFSIGNRSSLLKVSQETLKTWYQQHYSANRMRLIVISNQPLENLQKIVVDNFKDIPNHNLPDIDVKMPRIPENLKGHMVYIEPIKNIRTLALIWELPPQIAFMRDTKPEFLIGHVLSHEGKKSLITQLKKDKLAEGIACAGQRSGGNNFEFCLEIALTDLGVKNVHTVIQRCFEALANFKQKGLPSYLFDELHTMSIINYQHQAKEEAFSHIFKEAESIAYEDLSTYPEQTYLIKEFDPKAVENLLSVLTPENCVYDLVAPEQLTGVSLDQEEPWLQVPYAVKAIPQDLLLSWKHAAPNPAIDLPESNPFIPEKLALVSNAIIDFEKSESLPIHPKPTLIADNDHGKIYFAQDAHYATPKVSCSFEVKTPFINTADIESIVLGDLFVKYALDALNTYTYPASVAGLDFSISRTNEGLFISIEGYSDKANVLFLDLLKNLKHLRLQEKKFKTFKDALSRGYQNASLDKPLSQAYEVLKSILYKDFATEKSKAMAIKKITFERLEEFSAALFTKTYTEGLIYGNMLEEPAKNIATQLFATLDSQPYPKSEQQKREVLLLPNSDGPFFIESKSKVQGNAAILAIEIEPFSFQNKAAQQILMQAMREPFFSTLRTKQQTGYIVSSQSEELELHLLNIFSVQSNTHDGRDLLARFELFIEDYMQEISKTEITQERFENIKQALLSTLKRHPNNFSEMASLLYKMAFIYKGDFSWLDKRIKALEEISYTDFLEKAKQMMGKQNKRRLGILLNGTLSEEASIKYKRAAAIAQLRQLGTFEPALESHIYE